MLILSEKKRHHDHHVLRLSYHSLCACIYLLLKLSYYFFLSQVLSQSFCVLPVQFSTTFVLVVGLGATGSGIHVNENGVVENGANHDNGISESVSIGLNGVSGSAGSARRTSELPSEQPSVTLSEQRSASEQQSMAEQQPTLQQEATSTQHGPTLRLPRAQNVDSRVSSTRPQSHTPGRLGQQIIIAPPGSANIIVPQAKKVRPLPSTLPILVQGLSPSNTSQAQPQLQYDNRNQDLANHPRSVTVTYFRNLDRTHRRGTVRGDLGPVRGDLGLFQGDPIPNQTHYHYRGGVIGRRRRVSNLGQSTLSTTRASSIPRRRPMISQVNVPRPRTSQSASTNVPGQSQIVVGVPIVAESEAADSDNNSQENDISEGNENDIENRIDDIENQLDDIENRIQREQLRHAENQFHHVPSNSLTAASLGSLQTNPSLTNPSSYGGRRPQQGVRINSNHSAQSANTLANSTTSIGDHIVAGTTRTSETTRTSGTTRPTTSTGNNSHSASNGDTEIVQTLVLTRHIVRTLGNFSTMVSSGIAAISDSRRDTNSRDTNLRDTELNSEFVEEYDSDDDEDLPKNLCLKLCFCLLCVPCIAVIIVTSIFAGVMWLGMTMQTP